MYFNVSFGVLLRFDPKYFIHHSFSHLIWHYRDSLPVGHITMPWSCCHGSLHSLPKRCLIPPSMPVSLNMPATSCKWLNIKSVKGAVECTLDVWHDMTQYYIHLHAWTHMYTQVSSFMHYIDTQSCIAIDTQSTAYSKCIGICWEVPHCAYC